MNGNRRSFVDLETNRAYFGCYFNLARHYAFLVLQDLSERFRHYSIKPPKEDGLHDSSIVKFIASSKDNRMSQGREVTMALISKFPFLEAFSKEGRGETNPEEVNIQLKQLLGALNSLRNMYSHAEGSSNTFKKIEKLPLEELFNKAKIGIVKKFRQTFEEKDIAHLNPTKKPYKLFDDDGQISTQGKIFLVCLFLDREYAFKFLSGIKGFSTHERNFRATLECFTYFCLRLPARRLDSSDIKMDVLAELNRCPKEVYRVLEAKDQERFEVEVDMDSSDGETDEISDIYTPKAVFKRSENRFPYLVLRFFDDQKWFDRLRFQLYFGRVNTSNYLKTINKIESMRRTTKDLRAFVRWDDISEHNLPKLWKDKDKEALHPAIEGFTKRYHIVGNRISIKFVNSSSSIGNCISKIFDRKKKNQEHCSGIRVSAVAPDAILSIYELPNLFVYTWLYRRNDLPQSPEDFIQGYVKKFKALVEQIQKNKKNEYEETIQEMREEYGLKPSSFLTKALLNHYLGLTCRETDMERLIKKMNRVKKQLRKKIDKRSQAGEMATYLAKDLVFLMPPGSHKPNNEEYNELQALLAYFGKEKDQLKAYFQELSLTGSGPSHPFLHHIVYEWKKLQGIRDFYRAYLNEKIKWVGKKIRELKQGDVNMDELLPFFPISVKAVENRSYLSIPQQDLEAPTVLPRGLFNRAIVKAFMEKKLAQGIKEKDNLAYVLKRYFNDSIQPFYIYDRIYKKKIIKDGGKAKNTYELKEIKISDVGKLLSQLKREIKTAAVKAKKGKVQDRFKDLCSLKKWILDNEKQINLLQMQDRVLWLMFAEMFQDNLFDVELKEMELSSLGFDQGGTKLFRREFPVQLKLQDRIIIANQSLKKYGGFRRFLKDRRLWSDANGKKEESGLILYWEKGDKISVDDLKKLLDQYEKSRLLFFAEVLRFEEKVAKTHPTIYEKYGEKHSDLLENLVNEDEALVQQLPPSWSVQELIVVRNRLFHNQFPFFHRKERISPNDVISEVIDAARKIYENLSCYLENCSS